jgi:hypothetical protein
MLFEGVNLGALHHDSNVEDPAYKEVRCEHIE